MNFLKDIRIGVAFLLLIFGLFTINTASAPQLPHDLLKKLSVIDTKQITCLANNIYHEARGETFNGQVAVARVVVNRVRHGFGKNVCAVVHQSLFIKNENGEVSKRLCQFSWVCENKNVANKNSTRYKQAQQIAYDVLVHNMYTNIIPKTALFFHNITVDPSWPYKKVTVIGNHIFYSREKTK